MKTISFGGLGDTFSAYLKIKDLCLDSHLFVTDCLHKAKLCYEWTNSSFINPKFKVASEFCYGYLICKDLGVWDDRIEIDYLVSPKDKLDINPYVVVDKPLLKYDACIQIPVGIDPLRQWPFDPRILKKEFENCGLNVCLIGWNDKFKNNDENNFVGRLSLVEIMNITLSSKLMVANLGFQSLFKLATKGNVVYFTGNVDADNYIYPQWKKHSIYLSDPSLENVWNQSQKIITNIN